MATKNSRLLPQPVAVDQTPLFKFSYLLSLQFPGVWCDSIGRLQDDVRGDKEGQEAPLRRVLHSRREADRRRDRGRAQRRIRPVPRAFAAGRHWRVQVTAFTFKDAVI